VLRAPAAEVAGRAFNVSDLLVDRHDLLAAHAARHGIAHAPPPRAEGPSPNVMDTARLRALGWRPGGWTRLMAFRDGQ